MLKAVRFILLVGGLALTAFLFSQHAGTVRESLSQVGWGFLLYLTVTSVIYLLDTWGWRAVFGEDHAPVPFSRLFWVQRAGEAANKVTPLASMGGEPLKIYLLARDGANVKDAFASVAVSKTLMTLGQVCFIFLGAVLAIREVPGREGFFLGFAAFPGAILAAIIVTAILDLRLRRTRRTAPPTGLEEAVAPKRRSPGAWVLETWGRVADYFYAHPRESLLSFALFFLGWAAGALEMLAGAYVLGFPLSVSEALAFEALIVSVNMATFLIPANVGTQEGGYVYLAPILGVAAPHALALAVLRRCRDVLWIIVGLLYLAFTEGRILLQPQFEPSETSA